jgi:hypothetical protein
MCFVKLPPGWRAITRESISELNPPTVDALGSADREKLTLRTMQV